MRFEQEEYEEIKKAFHKAMVLRPMPYIHVAKEIGINRETLCDFLKSTRKTNSIQVAKIKKYIENIVLKYGPKGTVAK